jgi:flavin-binding protein dodecin
MRHDGLHPPGGFTNLGARSLPIREEAMAVARVTKITSSSSKNFQDAVDRGLARAARTLRGITGLEVVSQKAKVAKGKISEYRITMEVTFILDE